MTAGEMTKAVQREIYFSFFMFTADLQPDNPDYTEVIARHMRELSSYGYDGFDLPIAPTTMVLPTPGGPATSTPRSTSAHGTIPRR